MIWWRPELRVLFVCTANVCRSPLAEAMLRQRLRVLGLSRRVQVRSAGTEVGQTGRPPDPRVRKLAQEAGFALGRIRARQVTAAMLSHSDYVLLMEPAHRQAVAALVPGGDLPLSVRLLGEYIGAEGGATPVIPDPYFSDWQGFVEVFREIDSALDGLTAELVQRLLAPLPG